MYRFRIDIIVTKATIVLIDLNTKVTLRLAKYMIS